MSKHTITVREITQDVIEHVLASASGRQQTPKQLIYQHDLARNRTYFLVRSEGHEYAFETLAEAVEAYNEI